MPRTLSSQVGILFAGSIVAFAALFFVPLVNVRSLTVEDYGYYRQFWLLFETLSSLLILGFPRSLLYYFPRVEDRKTKSVYVTQTIAYLFAVALVACLVYFLIASFLGHGFGGLVKRFYWRLSLFTLLMMVSQYLDSLFVAEKQVVRQSVYHAAVSFFQAAVVISISWYTRDLETLIWALTMFALAKFLFALTYTEVVYRPKLTSVSISSIKEQFSYAIPLGMAAIMLVLVTQTDKFVINRFLGREAFAVYVIGAFQIPFVAIIRQSINSVTFPLMSKYQKENRHDEILSLWRRSTLKTTALFFPIFVFLEVSAQPFITILFTETYAAAAPVFAIYLLLFLRSSIDFGGVISAYRQNQFLFRVNAVAFVANLVLSVVLFKAFGRLGVPVATTITMYGILVVVVFKTGLLLHQPVIRLLPWAGLLKRFIAAAVPGVLLYVVYRQIAVDSFVVLAAAAGAYFAVYFLITFLTKLITPSDLKSIVGRR